MSDKDLTEKIAMNNEKNEEMNSEKMSSGTSADEREDARPTGTSREFGSSLRNRPGEAFISTAGPSQTSINVSRSQTDRTDDSQASMAPLWATLAGFGAGLATMYLLDPTQGARRRALISDQFTRASTRLPQAFMATERDMFNRTQGLWADITSLLTSDDPADQVVEARVRSKIGRVCSHPHAIHVSANNGRVTLSGPVLADEVPAIVSTLEKIQGVNEIENALQEFDSPEGVSSLQGGGSREMLSEFQQQNWSPTARFLAGTAGTAALAYSLAKRDLASLGVALAGAALLARSATNTEIKRLIGTGDGHDAVTVEKTIRVNAPPDVLFKLWSNFENFPLFMSNVLEVSNAGGNVSHWKVAGPAGIPVEWDAEVTKLVPNEMIAWKSIPGSTVANAGYVLFEPMSDDTTEVHVKLSYTPPAGTIGHFIAKAFGADPKTELDQDLMRMKTYLETGRIPHDASKKVSGSARADRIH